MAQNERRGADKLIDQIREAADRLAGAVNDALRGPTPAPAIARVRRPTPEETRRHIRQRRGY